MERRSDWVDYAKAIGIILVVYGHTARGLNNAGIGISKDLFTLVDSIVYSFHMPLFFFLSGLFFYSSFAKRGGTQLIFNKIDTIVYPYILWSLLQGFIEAALAQYTNGGVGFGSIFGLFWSPRAQFWFLYALFVFFLLSVAIFSVVSARMALPAFALSAVLYIFPGLLPHGFIFDFITQFFVFFVFGIVFSQYLTSVRFTSPFIITGSVVLFVLGQYLFHGYLQLNYADRGVASLLLATLSILTVVSVSSLIAQGNYRFLAYLGTSSMAIYLMHIIFGAGSRVALKSFLGIHSFAIHLVCGMACGLLLPLIVLRITEKLNIPYLFSAPISRWLNATYSRTAQKAAP